MNVITDIPAWEKQKLYEFLKRLEYEFSTRGDHVRYIGTAPAGTQTWRVPCNHNHFRLMPVDDGQLYTETHSMVTLSWPYLQIDNLLRVQNDYLVGRCDDCGQIYVVALEPKPMLVK
jgi:hypothetical protein